MQSLPSIDYFNQLLKCGATDCSTVLPHTVPPDRMDGSLSHEGGWERQEVLHLVLSLFEDSDYRRDALHRIKSE